MNYEEFESLNAEEQAKVISKTALRERGDLILLSHQPGLITKALAAEELYLMIREMDMDERCELIRHASLSQLSFIADIDCWNRDLISTPGFIRWLETLLAADEKKLLAWLLKADTEGVVAGFKKFVTVVKPDWEWAADEILKDRPYFTLDQRYYILTEEENMNTVRRVIEVLFENYKGRYAALLEGIMGESDYEVEEEAYQNRGARLGERGFPDMDVARSVYQPFARETYEKFPLKDLRRQKQERERRAEESKMPAYPVLWTWDRLFLDDVLLAVGEFDPGALESVHEEMVWLVNKMMVLEGIDFSSEGKVRRNVMRMRSILNMALELLSDRDLKEARDILRKRWLEAVFRYGVGEIFAVRDEARGVLADYWRDAKDALFLFLEAPYESIFRGLLQNFPEVYDDRMIEDLHHLRDFRNSEDLERSRRAVLQIRRIHEFVSRQVTGIFQYWNHAREKTGAAISLFALLGTFYVHFILKGRISRQPVSQDELMRFFEKAFLPEGDRRILNPVLKNRFLGRLFSEEERDLLRALWGAVFQNIQEQCGRLKLKGRVHPDFLDCIYFKKDVPAAAKCPKPVRSHGPKKVCSQGMPRSKGRGFLAVHSRGVRKTRAPRE